MENEQLRTSRRGSGDDEECKRSPAAETWAPESSDAANQVAAVNHSQSSRRSAGGNGAASAVPGEVMGSEGAVAAGGGPAYGRLNRTGGHGRGGRGRRASTEVCPGIWCCEDVTELETLFDCNNPRGYSTLLAKFWEGSQGGVDLATLSFLAKRAKHHYYSNITCSSTRAC